MLNTYSTLKIFLTMKKITFLSLILCFTMGCATPNKAIKDDFIKGADVGFLTGQEARGQKFFDTKGNERECLELLKNDYQISAIRLRVWVNPRGGSCDKNEVLAMLKQTIRPEFLNRIDEIIMFTPLNEKEIKEITNTTKIPLTLLNM